MIGLNDDEKQAIDEQAAKNRKAIYIFVRDLPANGKIKTKNIIPIIALVTGVWIGIVQPAQGVGLN